MKKIFFVVIIFICFKGFGQTGKYPGIQTLGSDSTLVESKGAFKSRLINRPFTDTAQANTQRIKWYEGAQLWTTTDKRFWIRDSLNNIWLLPAGTGGGGSDTANLLVKRRGSGKSIFGINNDTLLLKDNSDGVFTIWENGPDSSSKVSIDTASAGFKAWANYYGPLGHGQTPGAVAYINSTGGLGTDPATFFYNDVDNQLYIGQNTGNVRLNISDGATVQVKVTNLGGSGTGAGGFVAVGHDDGAAMADLDRLGGILGFGRLSSTVFSDYNNGAAVEFIAAGAWTLSSSPADIVFTTTPSGALNRVRAMTIASTRNVGFGNNITDPTAIIHIRPPTSAAGTGQLKFETGTLPTTPETGLMNFKDGLWFIDSSTSIRDTIATREWARANITGTGGGGSSTFVGLTDGPGAFAGQAGKSVRVNTGETALEYFTISAGGGDVFKVGTPVNNYLGVWTGDGTIEGDIDLQFNGTQLGIQGVPGFPLDIWNGSIAIVAGGDALASTRTNATTKNFRMGSAHYTNAEEPVAVFHVANSSGTNQLFIGGGTGTMNAISDFAIYTTAGGTTLTGSEKLSITNTQMVINETGLNFDFRLEADADANMLTIDANALTGNVGAMGVGTAIGSVAAKFHITSTLEQQRTGYDASNYFSTTVSSTGSPTFNAVGTSPEFNFSDNIRMASNLITAGDLTLVALDVDASPDTLTSIEGGVISKYVIPIISGYTAVDSLMSGQYTPTLANVANVAGTTAVLVNYQKIGSMVHVQGVGSCTVTASGGTLTTMSITLPFASAMTLVTDCSGSGTARTSAAALPAYVATNTTTDVAEVSFYSGSGSHDVHFSFTYKVK